MQTVKKVSVVTGSRRGERNKWSTEDFQGSENALYETVTVDT